MTIDGTIGALRHDLTTPDAQRETQASDDSLNSVIGLLEQAVTACDSGATDEAQAHLASAARIAIDEWNISSSLSDRVIGLQYRRIVAANDQLTVTIFELSDATQTHAAKLRIGPNHAAKLDLKWADNALQSQGHDLFDALIELRRELENQGRNIAVQGACADVWPSGSSREQPGGRKAYRLPAGRVPTPDDLVDIFGPAAPAEVVTVDEQNEAVQRYFSS